MAKVIGESSVGKYKILKIDQELPTKPYSKYVIDGKDYNIVPIYDAHNCIAIADTGSLIGKTVNFV